MILRIVILSFCLQKNPATLLQKLTFGAYSKQFEDGEWLSADAENNAAYHADALCGFTCSFRFYRDFFRGLRRLYTKKYIAGLQKTLPVLLISGECDPVGDMGKGVKKLFSFYTQRAKMQNVQCVLLKNSRHEFLNEAQDRAEKWGAVAAFLQSVPLA